MPARLLGAVRRVGLNDSPPSSLVRVYLEKRQDLVRYFAMRLSSEAAAEDVVQDIYVRIVTAEIGLVERPAAFLYRLGSNLMLDRLKQSRRSEVRDDAWHASQYQRAGGEDLANSPSPEEAAASSQRVRRLAAAVKELPPQRRRAFELHKLEGLSHAATAAAMGISKSAVEKHISAALKHLLSRLSR